MPFYQNVVSFLSQLKILVLYSTLLQIIARMPEGDIASDDDEHRLLVQLRAADLRRHEVPREQAAHPPRLGRQKHSRLLEKSCQSFGLRSLESPRRREGLLPDQLQRQSQVAHCLVRLTTILH